MSRIEYQAELKSLHNDIITMGSRVEEQFQSSIQALLELDPERARAVIAGDDEIDRAEQEIHHACVLLIARQQPVASDLRDLTANMRLITDLERIADHAEDISQLLLELTELGNQVMIPHDFVTMTSHAQRILREALNAYVTRQLPDAELAIAAKADVSNLYQKLKAYLTRQMQLDAEAAPSLVNLLLIAADLERAAAHAQNVAEWVIYFVSGQYARDFEEWESQDGLSDLRR